MTSWTVSFGDGAPNHTGTGRPPASLAHNYFSAGTFTAALTVTDAAGHTASSTVAVDEAPAPTLEVGGPTYSGLSATLPLTAFAAGDAHLASYSVEWGDGSEDTGMTAPPSSLHHTYAAPGSYGTYVVVIDDHGGSDIGYDPSTGNTKVSTQLLVDPSAVSAAHISLDGQILDHATTGTIAYSDGDTTDVDFSDSICPLQGATTFTYTLDSETPHHIKGSSADLDLTLGTHTLALQLFCGSNTAVAASTTATFQAADSAVVTGLGPAATAIAAGGTVTLADTTSVEAPNTIASYNVYWGDGTTDMGAGAPPSTLHHTYPLARAYTVDLVIHDAFGGGNDNYQVGVTVTADTPSFGCNCEEGDYANNDNTFSANWVGVTTSTDLTETTGPEEENDTYFAVDGILPATGGTLSTFDLNFGDGTPDYKGNLSPNDEGIGTVDREHAYVIQGDFIAVLTVTDTNGATAAETMTISVDPPATLTLTLSNSTPRSGDTITVTPAYTAGGTAISDHWIASGENYGGGGTQANPTTTPLGNGTPQPVTFHVTGPHGQTGVIDYYYDTDHGQASAQATFTIAST